MVSYPKINGITMKLLLSSTSVMKTELLITAYIGRFNGAKGMHCVQCEENFRKPKL